MSFYARDKVFLKLYNEAENIEEIYTNKNNKPNLPLMTPFLQKKRKDKIEKIRKEKKRLFDFYNFKGPFELLHADIADLRFLAKSAADPKYCLLVVDLFTYQIYSYPMKKRTLLKKKLEQFYSDILKKRKPDQEMRLQTDQEFQQKEIKKIYAANNVTLFSMRTRGGKAFVAEQKIRELKKIILKNKRIEKRSGARISPKKLIKKATGNLSKTYFAKYSFTPDHLPEDNLFALRGQFE